MSARADVDASALASVAANRFAKRPIARRFMSRKFLRSQSTKERVRRRKILLSENTLPHE